MTDTDVRDALYRATRHLEPHPGLLDDVRRGGHARLVRRRSVLTAGLTAVAAGAGAWQLPSGRSTHGPTDGSGGTPFDRPTAGDLAGDRAHLRRVLDVWDAYVPVDPAGQDPYGDPHVTWTGATPAGPAAFVVQRNRKRPGDREGLLLGLVATTGGSLAVVDQNAWSPQDGVSYSHAYLLGPGRDVLLVRDADTPVRYSTALRYGTDGRVQRTFRPVPFAGGAAVLAVRPQAERVTVALTSGAATDPQPMYLGNIEDLKTRSGLPLTGSQQMGGDLPGASAAWPTDALTGVDDAERAWAYPVLLPYLDVGGNPPFSFSPDLHLIGATPDGRRLLVRTQAVSNGHARVLFVWGRADAVPTVRYAGVRDVSGPLELALRLPDRQGVVIAAPNATLRHRAGRGAWSPPVESWSLVPDAVTEVEVTAQGGRTTRVAVR